MIEIRKNLFVGSAMDYEFDVKNRNGWAIVHACKEPYHRKAVGYGLFDCSKNHPEYFVAYRGDRLMLNLLDVANPKLIHSIAVDAAIEFIDDNLAQDKKVLLHCSAGMSRSAGIGLLYLACLGEFSGMDYSKAQRIYKNLYPPFAPARGMTGYMMKNWSKYCRKDEDKKSQ